MSEGHWDTLHVVPARPVSDHRTLLRGSPPSLTPSSNPLRPLTKAIGPHSLGTNGLASYTLLPFLLLLSHSYSSSISGNTSRTNKYCQMASTHPCSCLLSIHIIFPNSKRGFICKLSWDYWYRMVLCEVPPNVNIIRCYWWPFPCFSSIA